MTAPPTLLRPSFSPGICFAWNTVCLSTHLFPLCAGWAAGVRCRVTGRRPFKMRPAKRNPVGMDQGRTRAVLSAESGGVRKAPKGRCCRRRGGARGQQSRLYGKKKRMQNEDHEQFCGCQWQALLPTLSPQLYRQRVTMGSRRSPCGRPLRTGAPRKRGAGAVLLRGRGAPRWLGVLGCVAALGRSTRCVISARGEEEPSLQEKAGAGVSLL